ncbi:type IV toxin-antitoxin system AbiEi family antitoxin [Azotobacter bryophylli]|uniref:Type IV toxin-antitoxin system AbiEi family antitoxin n=1 Tax=Azotobacter bryophylli TaxID=1986537 RepID=A0ABV7AQB6_9GAMM
MHEPLISAFAQAVKDATGSTLTEIRTNPMGGLSEPDAIGLLDTPDGAWPLVFSIKKDVYPRDVRDAMWDLQSQQSRMKNPSEVVLIMLADHLSKGAREELKSRGMSFFDSSGTLFLKHRNWLINIEKAKSSTKGISRELDVFKGSREMVVHALLHMGRDWFHGQEVVDMSKTSGYTVSTVLQELEKFGWVESQGEGRHRTRRLVKPTELLDAWAKVWVQRKQATTRWYFFCQNPKRLVEELASNIDMYRHMDWDRDRTTCAFTGAVAANRLSPLLTHVDIAELIVSSNSDELARRIGLKPAEKGANVVLIERSGASELFQQYSQEDDAWFASPFIQYLDLLNGRGRNAELAAQLRNDILRV